jgi:hypothetical protein
MRQLEVLPVLLSEYFPNQVKYNLKFKNKGSSTEFKKN